MDDRRNGVEEGELVGPGLGGDGVGQRGRRERSGGDDGLAPFARRQAGDLLAQDGDKRMRLEARRDRAEKPSRSTASAPPAGT